MQGLLRMAHLVVGAIAVVAFLIAGMLMSGHDPPVAAMEWGERLLIGSLLYSAVSLRRAGRSA